MITRHAELAEHLLAQLDQVPFLASNLRKKDMLLALDQDSLRTFFDYDLSLGVFVAGGAYLLEPDLRAQAEEVEVIIAIGSRNLSSDVASLGAGDELGCWDLLEQLRQFYTNGAWLKDRGNIDTIQMRRWRTLLAISGLAILGLEIKVRLLRPVSRTDNLERFGSGYPAN